MRMNDSETFGEEFPHPLFFSPNKRKAWRQGFDRNDMSWCSTEAVFCYLPPGSFYFNNEDLPYQWKQSFGYKPPITEASQEIANWHMQHSGLQRAPERAKGEGLRVLLVQRTKNRIITIFDELVETCKKLPA